jgi:hypothetical protein
VLAELYQCSENAVVISVALHDPSENVVELDVGVGNRIGVIEGSDSSWRASKGVRETGVGGWLCES